jgi:hypothetical protein
MLPAPDARVHFLNQLVIPGKILLRSVNSLTRLEPLVCFFVIFFFYQPEDDKHSGRRRVLSTPQVGFF